MIASVHLRILHQTSGGASVPEFAGALQGLIWASLNDSDHERQNLQALRARCRPHEWDDFFREGPEEPHAVRDRLFYELNPEYRDDCLMAEAYWDEYLPETLRIVVEDSAAWLRGFAEGALKYWSGEMTSRVRALRKDYFDRLREELAQSLSESPAAEFPARGGDGESLGNPWLRS